MSPARRAALDALVSIDRGRSTLPDAMERARRTLDDPRDRALVLELVAGTLRWRNALDAVLTERSRRPVDELDPVVRAILRLSAFQLLNLDRVPAHAIVDDAVELSRAWKRTRATGFVNAVLRSLARQPGTDALPDAPGPGGSRAAQLLYLSVTLSHPGWLVERWLDRFGYESTEAWCRFNNEPPAIVVRARPGAEAALEHLVDDPASGVRRSPVLAHVGIVGTGGLGRLPSAIRDQVVTQDEGSQLLAHATPLPPAGRVLDLCAAPGNKTTILAERAGAGVRIVAADHRPARVATLRATLAERALSIPVVRLDARAPLPFGPVFDTVLVDAPCSGLGTLRREPDLKWRRQPSDLRAFATVQASMLRSAAAIVGEGGCILYATCSSEPDENDEVVDAFLRTHSGFAREPLSLPPPVLGPVAFIESDGCLRTRPFRDGLDAYFAAVLVRRRAA
ncbi:MAG TPA: transcription antitermination factor NusB [Vicinamibacterales bacterium]|nr:transcription antitermination factor NusB [Vicinamibacterales bacterium]